MSSNTKRTFIAFALCMIAAFVLLSARTTQAQSTTPPLSNPGEYGVGQRFYTLVDTLRDNREIPLAVWYPTEPPARRRPYIALQENATPLIDDAPYPVVVYSHGGCHPNTGTYEVAPTLASHGFVVISGEHYPEMMAACGREPITSVVNRPLDVRFMLDSLPTLDEDLTPIIDMEHIGITGYSWGAYTAVATSGAQVHPSAISDICADDSSIGYCMWLRESWDEIVAIQALYGVDADNNVWSNLVDDRITAALAVSVCYSRIFGEEGLAMMEVPLLALVARRDNAQSCNYEREALYLRDHISSEDVFFYTYNAIDTGWGGPHYYLVSEEYKTGQHFAVAFFSYFLKGDESYLPYLDISYVETPDSWDTDSD